MIGSSLRPETVLTARCRINLGSSGVSGDGLRSNPTKAARRALPRRTSCTNSKDPRYSGSFSCEIPRCGRSRDRGSDQDPSIVLTCTSLNPSPSSSRANSPAS
jgi:hypothetical protein